MFFPWLISPVFRIDKVLSGGTAVFKMTGPLRAVGNASDCRSRGPKFDPGPAPYFCVD